MPKFNDHIAQAKRNLAFLEIINKTAPEHCDWQVTTCFYTALHLVNARIAQFGLQYRSHSDVKFHINPTNEASVMKIPEDIYTSYESLFSLSRRSRYLTNEKDNNLFSDIPAFTNSKHLAKSIRHLNIICTYFCKTYDVILPKISIKCDELIDRGEFINFKIIK